MSPFCVWVPCKFLWDPRRIFHAVRSQAQALASEVLKALPTKDPDPDPESYKPDKPSLSKINATKDLTQQSHTPNTLLSLGALGV